MNQEQLTTLHTLFEVAYIMDPGRSIWVSCQSPYFQKKKKKIVTLNFLHKKNFSMLFAFLEIKLVTVAETIG